MEKLKHSQILQAGAIFTMGTLLGRFLGLGRELVLAHVLGVSVPADIVVLLLTLPDIAVRALFSRSLTPFIFKVPYELRSRYFKKLSLKTALYFVLVSFVLAALAAPVTKLLGPGLEGASLKTATYYFRWSLVAVPFLAMAAISRAFLQAHHTFSFLAFENATYNLVLLLGLAFIYPVYGLEGIVAFIVIGSFVRWAPQVVQILKTLPDSSKKQAPEGGWPTRRFLFQSYSQALGANAIMIALVYLARSIASWQVGEGAISLFNYVHRVTNFPMALGFLAVSTVMLPRLTEAFSDPQKKDLAKKQTQRSFQFTWMLTLPLAVYFGWFLWGLQDTPFSFGQLTDQNTMKLAFVSVVGLIGLPAKALTQLNIVVMTAKHDTRSPFLTTAIALVLAVPVVTVFSRAFGLTGVFLAISLIFWLHCLMGLFILDQFHRLKTLFGSQFLVITMLSLVPLPILFLIEPVSLLARLSAAVATGLLVWLVNGWLFYRQRDQ